MTYQEARMRQLLAEASLMAEASSQMNFHGRTTHSKPGDMIPTIGGTSTFDAISRRFANARTTEQKHNAIVWAQRELDTLRGRRRPKGRTERQIVLEDCVGDTAKEAAQKKQASETNVRRWREQAGLHPNTGKREAA